MKTRTLVALALLAVIGALTVWKVTRPDPHVRSSKATSPLSVKKEDIDELEIAQTGKPAIVLKKDGAEWKLVQPLADRADQKAVEQALETISELQLRDVIAESPESYEKVGLKEDETVKVIPRKAGTPLATLIVGKTTNVRLDGDPRVYSTANLKRFALVKEVKAWRDRQILDAPVDEIDRLEVVYPSGSVVAKKETPPAPASDPQADPKAPPPPAPAGKWVLLEGADKLGGTLDENVPLELASTLARLMADDFAEGTVTPAAAGLEPPRATVKVTRKDGKTSTLLVGKEEEQKVYVKLAETPRIWKINKWEADRIPSSPAQWRDKTIARVEPSDVTKIEVTKDKERTLLERVDDKTWKSSAGEVDQNKVQAILRTTQTLRATRVLDGIDAKTAGLDKPRATLILTKKDGTQTKLILGADKDGQSPVQITGQKDLYSLPSYQTQTFLADLKPAATPDPHGHPM